MATANGDPSSGADSIPSPGCPTGSSCREFAAGPVGSCLHASGTRTSTSPEIARFVQRRTETIRETPSGNHLGGNRRLWDDALARFPFSFFPAPEHHPKVDDYR